MRKLTRPEPPEWWEKFEHFCLEELNELVAESPNAAIPSGYLSKSRFFRRGRERDFAMQALSQASGGVCHTCGSDMLASGPQIEHYRPKLNAANHRKDRSTPRHYWWILADWHNLQVICPVCNRHKRNLFPIAGERAHEGARGEGLQEEGALIINPFDDDPLDHVRLKRNGRLGGITERGGATIEAYALNRRELVDKRAQLLEDYRQLIPASQRRVRSIEERDLMIEHFGELASPYDMALVPLLVDSFIRITGLPSPAKTLVETPPSSAAMGRAKAVPVDLQSGWIKDVKIRDFGPIESLDISFPSLSSSKEPWLGVVGENGVGKSTFLKAVTLALVDETNASVLVSDASKLKNRNTRRRSGYVEVTMSDDRRRRVTVRSKSRAFEYSGDRVNIPVIALGANRITSRKGAAKELPSSTAVDNLFDPVLPLVDIEEWLADTSRVSAEDFSVLGDNLKSLMDLPISTEVTRLKGKIYFKRQNSRLSLDEMSDGFRSVIGLTTHIMKYLAAETPIMSEAEGTVLLDELELHLHPLWKIQIVIKLRELFPRVRFIISTHDPLCLHGFQADETHVFRRHPETDEIEVNTLSIRPGMNVDDLLTGGWFGLGTTYDQDTEDKIHELSALSLKEDALKLREDATLPDEERAAMEELSTVLSSRLAGFSSSETEKAMLSKVVRSAIDLDGDDGLAEIDPSLLQDRIKLAFDKGD